MIPYSKQIISNEDINSVLEVLKSDWLTQGPMIEKFEKKVSSICGKQLLGTAYNSATSALHAACYALGLREGDILWTVPNSFVASANCAIFCGAQVDFVDIDPKSWNMCPISLKDKLESAEHDGKLPKIIIPVHFSGMSAEMAVIHKLAMKYGIKVIEDASHALGASYNDTMVGSCKYSDITVFSFHPVKMITTGEGGMAVTKDENLDGKMKLFRNHGITRDRRDFKNADIGPWSYQQIGLGYNYRMTDIAAALGLSQLKTLHKFISERRAYASHYSKVLDGTPYVSQETKIEHNSSWHLYVICIPDTKNNRNNRLAIFRFLREQKIGVNVHYEPIHLQPFYRKMGFRENMFLSAENYSERCLSIPLFPTMTTDTQNYILKALNDGLELIN